MRIGILTQKLESNYGGIMQNYALQYTLKELGHTPYTIDFRPGDSILFYILFQLKNLFLLIKGKPYKFRKYSSYKTHRPTYISVFVKKHIKTTQRVQVLTPILPYIYRFKSVIVGSDQVWRKDYNVLKNTYLTFVHGNISKIAYAASFGVSNWDYTENETNNCRKWIRSFKAVSTRESNGVELCKKYLNIDAINVLDPTILLEKKIYEDLCENITCNKTPFMYAYILDENDIKKNIIHKISEEKNIPVIWKSAEKNISVSVEEWVSLFRDANYVITDSFHGMCFSIIFKKSFNVLLNESRGQERFLSLLNNFHLGNRIISNDNIDCSEDIDWDMVSTVINKKRTESIDFLRNNLIV